MQAENKTWDMIIIGGGIAGASAAYYAAKEGLKTLLVERDSISAAQSGRHMGVVRCVARDMQEIPMMIDAMDIWRGLEKELGRSIDWREGGMLCCAGNDSEMKRFQTWQKRSREFNLKTKLLSPSDIDVVVPGMVNNFVGALYCEDDGTADPLKSTRAFCDAAIELGAEVAMGQPVAEIVSEAGSVKGVRIGQHLLRSKQVLVAAGSASNKLLRKHGVLFPQDIVRASILRTAPVKQTIQPVIVSSDVGIRQAKDKSLHLYYRDVSYDVRLDSARYASWFKHFMTSDALSLKINLVSKIKRKQSQAKASPINDIPASWEAPYPDHEALAKGHVVLGKIFPELKDVAVMSQWAGYIDATPDALPVVGKIDAVNGLLVASGYSGHGFALAPIVSKRIIELATTGQAEITKTFNPYRFANGTWRDIASTSALGA